MKNQTASLAAQMKHRDREMVPRILVQAMFALMFASLVLVGYARVTDRPLTGVAPNSPIVTERAITLDGSRSNGVRVLDTNGTQIAHSLENNAGFIDVIWTSIQRERTVNNVTTNDPLRLVRRENGHVALLDDATGWKIELIGYGKDNVAAFASLIQ